MPLVLFYSIGRTGSYRGLQIFDASSSFETPVAAAANKFNWRVYPGRLSFFSDDIDCRRTIDFRFAGAGRLRSQRLLNAGMVRQEHANAEPEIFSLIFSVAPATPSRAFDFAIVIGKLFRESFREHIACANRMAALRRNAAADRFDPTEFRIIAAGFQAF